MTTRRKSAANIETVSMEEALGKIDTSKVKVTNTSDLSQSPVLNQPVVEKEYTQRVVNPVMPITEPQIQAQTQQQPQANSSSSADDYEAEVESTYKPRPLPPEFAHIPDVPEQQLKTPVTPLPGSENPSAITPTPQAEGSENVDKLMEEGSDSLANTILGMWENVVPTMAHEVTKMKTRTLKDHIRQGDIDPSALDEVESRNKENLGLFKTQAKSDVKMMEKPLKKLLLKKGIQAPPHIELIMVLIVVVVMNAFLFVQIKKDGESLMNRLYAKIRDKKESDSIPLVDTEEVGASRKS